ncbi:MAG TPA: hypothetical protein PLN83_07260 [Syntrophorhabdus sp.]|nr:hypothetical protein [Syntrophorhabdus sp.]
MKTDYKRVLQFTLFIYPILFFGWATVSYAGDMLCDYDSPWSLNSDAGRLEYGPSQRDLWTLLDTGHAVQNISIDNNGRTGKACKVDVTGYGSDGDFKIYTLYYYDKLHVCPISKGNNRMILYSRVPNGNFTWHIGTYSTNPSNPDREGVHYYHYYENVQGNGNRYWTKFYMDEHPQHLVESKSDPGSNPTLSRGWDYFSGLRRMYFEMKYSEWNGDWQPYTVWIDDIEFYKETLEENTTSINSVSIVYMGSGKFTINWAGISQYLVHNERYQVKYSLTPIISLTDWNNASFVPGMPQGGYGSENVGHYSNDYHATFIVPALNEDRIIYFAIRDITPGGDNRLKRVDYSVSSNNLRDTTPPSSVTGLKVNVNN